MEWKKVSEHPPVKKGEYIVRSLETGAKHVLIFSGKYFYKIGNGFQSTQFEWLDESPQPSPPEQGKEEIELEQEAKDYAVDQVFDRNKFREVIKNAFIAGAKWAEQADTQTPVDEKDKS